MKIRTTRKVLLFLALAWALAMTLLTVSSFFVARGSDSGVEIYGPPSWIKIVTLVGVAAAWIASVVVRSWSAAARWILRLAGLVALGLATHLVVFNHRRGVLEEHWFHLRWDRIAYSRAEGLSQEWSAQHAPFGVELRHRTTQQSRFVFTGVPPWRSDLDAALQAP